MDDASRSTTGRGKESAHVRSKELWEKRCPRDRDVSSEAKLFILLKMRVRSNADIERYTMMHT